MATSQDTEEVAEFPACVYIIRSMPSSSELHERHDQYMIKNGLMKAPVEPPPVVQPNPQQQNNPAGLQRPTNP